MNCSLVKTQLIRWLALSTVGLALIGCIPQAPTDSETVYQDSRMNASVTYLHLLRHTPFFTELNDEQLKWVIKHSREWDAPAGTVLDSRAAGTAVSSDLWVLLDGGWQVETQTNAYAAGNGAPGKWYSPAQTQSDNRLVTIQRSYVMRIKAADLQTMLAQNFPFERHLSIGRAWYAHISAAQPRAVAP
ncbi:hypothetical protein C4J87_3193 [Pseudomonas sp. R1-43-08]|uniref:hypothetical protein n=1 Tax=Pseudomonas sp. R1-43-08 TaxID=1173270 RepID=UPI000F6F7CE4|nr:hypothetical protein [Pseudomonas sp. R1-43-08]AZF43345.1 hypothetical protein C4J87_3193 [Pseudomonas sp. R1-43-08]